ncbi:MAG: hypothetical protein M3Y84_05845 [Acidobacteriota bacterium]|nr:hypothetical protein [Acidobacteriota bacterium]
MRKVTFILLLATLLWTSMAFSCRSGPPPVGFTVLTTITFFGAMGIPVERPQTNVEVAGQWERDLPILGTVLGANTFFTGNSGAGKLRVNGARAPARWQFGEFSGTCANQSIVLDVRQNDGVLLNCDTTRPRPFGAAFSANPSSIDITYPPATVTITGQDLVATYGMPWVEYYDENGSLVAQTQAFSVAPDGSWLTGYTPDLSSVPTGAYTVVVSNVDPDGSLSIAGTTTINVFASVPDPPPDPCGCSGGRECMPCTY